MLCAYRPLFDRFSLSTPESTHDAVSPSSSPEGLRRVHGKHNEQMHANYQKAVSMEEGHTESCWQTLELPFSVFREKKKVMHERCLVRLNNQNPPLISALTWPCVCLLSGRSWPASASCQWPCWDRMISLFYFIEVTSEAPWRAPDAGLARRDVKIPMTTF